MNKYNNAIKEMINILNQEHLCFPINKSKEELAKYVDKLLNDEKIDNDYDFNYYANHVIKYALDDCDSHTKMACTSFKNTKLPIELKYIDNKLYVINTNGYNNILFKEITAINNIKTDKLVKELYYMTSCSTKEYLYNMIENNFVYIESLRCLKSINNNCDNITLSFNDDTNITFSTNKEYQKCSNNISNYSYEVKDNYIVLHINYCQIDYPNQMVDLVNKLTAEKVDNYIIDIRGNPGGADTIFQPLINYLKDKNVVTIVDEKVFSSASHLLMMLKQVGSKTVGTRIGTTLNHFGSRKQIYLKSLDNYQLNISTKYLYYNDGLNMGGPNTKEEYKRRSKKALKAQIFEPDIYVENSIEDYKNGYDRQLDVAIKEISKEKVK
jgi:hypothetical protein